MVWKSREDKAPPPQFFADVIGYLHHAFPGAVLTREAMEALAPHLVREWRHGQSARNAAKATCSCDGRVITVSPAAEVHLPRRAALAPASIPRGALFGIDALRERREIGVLRVKAAVETRHAEYQMTQLVQLQAERDRLLAAGKQAKADKVAKAMVEAGAALEKHRAQSAQLLQEAEQLTRARGYWIPPSAQETATAAATQKRGAKPKAPRAAVVTKAAPKEPVAKKARVSKEVPKATRPAPKKKCDLCTDKTDADLSALVDEFVDAAMKDEGK
jgi:hypothetical protein